MYDQMETEILEVMRGGPGKRMKPRGFPRNETVSKSRNESCHTAEENAKRKWEGERPKDQDGKKTNKLGLDGTEFFDIPVSSKLEPLSWITISAIKENGTVIKFDAKVRLDTPVEADYFRNGGILQAVLRNLAKK